MANQGVNVLALLKGGERYVFLYDDQSSDQLLQTLGQYASDPEMNFSWYDAAVLSQRIRQLRDSEVDDSPVQVTTEICHNRIRGHAA